MDEIRRADPDARRRAIRAVALAAVAGVLLILVAERQLPAVEAWLTQDLADTPRRLRLLAVGVGVVFGLPTAWFARTFWRLGTRVVDTEQLPTPEMRVTRDTRVMTGAAARARGRLLQALAAAMVLSVVVLVALLWRFAALVDARLD